MSPVKETSEAVPATLSDDQPVITVRGLKKRYGEVEAVRGIDLDVAPGETFGFLGPNGAGKTTTISMLCTLTRPTEGTAKVAGHDVVSERAEVRRNIGLVFQETTLDGYLSGAQNLRFHADLYGVPSAEAAERIAWVLDLVGLTDRRDSLVRTYSGGMRRRLEIARGLMHAPRVLFLDEPTIGLDPQTRAAIWKHIDELKRREKITIFLTTHYLEEAECCDRIAIIDHGRIAALDRPSALKAGVGEDRVHLETADDKAAAEVLRDRFGLEPVTAGGTVTITVPDGERFVPQLFEKLGVPIRAVRVARPSLDDVFLAHTGTSIRDTRDALRRGRMMMKG
ncbi:MAG TPA: ATP-binding cassette domain-containing protein [Streptosporangiaceae bacterium]